MRAFYDLTCPFCYLAQPLNKRMAQSGIKLIELPFQAHPEVPQAGMYMGPRKGSMYDTIAAQAKASGLPLKWRDTLPNSRLALAAAEWTRNHQPDKTDEVREKLFHAHFAGDKDIGDEAVILGIVEECGVDQKLIEDALHDGSATELVQEAGRIGRELGVMSTPSWESKGMVVAGLREAEVQHMFGL